MSARFDRRRMLLGSAGVLALPFFESLYPGRAWAQAMTTMPTSCGWLVFPEGVLCQGMYATPASPNDRLAIENPDGTTRYAFNQHLWEVTGTETNFQLPSTLAPLLPFKDDVLFATHGFKPNKGTAVDEGGGTGHSYGTSSYLTDVVFTMSGNTIVGGRSIDGLIAEALGVTSNRGGWLVLGSEVTNPTQGFAIPLNSLPIFDKVISWSTGSQEADQITNVQTAFDRLFPASTMTSTETPRARGKRSVLDFVRGEASTFKNKLNASDGARLDEYLTSVREVEQRVTSSATMPAASCTPGTRPPPVDSLLNFELHTRTMMDLIYLGIACGQTRVVSYLMDRDRTDRVMVPGVIDLSRHTAHHYSDYKLSDPAQANRNRAQHNLGSQWYLQRYADLLGRLKGHSLGNGKTLLDFTMMSLGTNFGESHGFRGVPYFIAGRGGGMRPGRYLSGGGAQAYDRNGDTFTKSAQLWLAMARKMGVNLPAIGRTTQAFDI